MTNFIRPVVEFFPLAPKLSKGETRWELFSTFIDEDREHRYYAGVKKELQESKGIYIFYDSRGQALYAGKARRQSLWNEMNNAYNRDRGKVQQINLVGHPINNVAFDRSTASYRKIKKTKSLRLHDLAYYFSAFEVQPTEMIPMLEALIIRGFANDLLNKKMEQFKK